MITGKLIKRMREEAGLTQEALAKAAGISQAHIAKIENEKVNPTLSTVNSILSILQANKKIKCKDFVSKNVISVKPEDSVNYVVKLMKKNDISQIPIIDKGRCVGSISDKTILRNLDKVSGSTEVGEIMDEPFPMISSNDNIDVIKTLLEYHQAVLILEEGRVVGIITKHDLLKLLK
jgi:predicted transcriptional regulator